MFRPDEHLDSEPASSSNARISISIVICRQTTHRAECWVHRWRVEPLASRSQPELPKRKIPRRTEQCIALGQRRTMDKSMRSSPRSGLENTRGRPQA